MDLQRVITRASSGRRERLLSSPIILEEKVSAMAPFWAMTVPFVVLTMNTTGSFTLNREHFSVDRKPTRYKFIQALRDIACRLISPNDPAVTLDPFLLEHKNILHLKMEILAEADYF